MDQSIPLFLFTALGLVFGVGVFIFAALVRARDKANRTRSVYECGLEPVGTPWVSPNIRFYGIALLFVVFDAEVLFLFPWAIAFQELGLAAFVEMVVFVAILFVGLIYAWRRGALRWE
ncbi:MAG TPA: NADH-quinone oxidoreductase subunit A [Elusimicrobiota bacterium]|nr:NADH-quinone oxidoreductase subunit A [Elusimicrobiota bacterium]